MTDTNYVYTLNDLYVMFREARDNFPITERPGFEVKLLIEWSEMNLPYLINWENVIKRHLLSYAGDTPEEFLELY